LIIDFILGRHRVRRVSRILLLLPTGTYRAADFVAAAGRLGVEVVVGSERRQAMAASMGDRAVVIPLDRVDAGVEAIAALHRRSPIDAVIAVDDQGLEVAAAASRLLGRAHNPPAAVAATRNKASMRGLLRAASVAQPDYRVVEPGGSVTDAAAALGYDCVVKPVSRSGSQGVIRAAGPARAAAAADRIRAIVGDDEPLLVERFVPGAEIAVEAILRDGNLQLLAVFDKPDPMDGPFFEETIYVTPSRQPEGTLLAAEREVAAAARAIGLREGPLHAELRIGPDRQPRILEVAARSIGGLCSRALRFGADIKLEEVVIAHAVGADIDGLRRETTASGVMMLPIRRSGILVGVEGRREASAVTGVAGIEITIPVGRPVIPLPEGDRYLGFVFARGPDPATVEATLRRAEAYLRVVVREPGPDPTDAAAEPVPERTSGDPVGVPLG